MSDNQPPILLGDPSSDVIAPITAAISITEDEMMDVVGGFTTGILGNIPVARGQDNRVPEPLGPNFVIITPIRRRQLSTTRHENSDGFLLIPQAPGIIYIDRPTEAHLQMDIYGPKSTDNAQIFTTLFRDSYGTEAMAGTGVQPLWCDDGRQMPLVNGEEQYEARWMINAVVQINPAVSTPAQFADTVAVDMIKAD